MCHLHPWLEGGMGRYGYRGYTHYNTNKKALMQDLNPAKSEHQKIFDKRNLVILN